MEAGTFIIIIILHNLLTPLAQIPATTYRQEACLSATEQLIAASSCQDVIDTQGDCMGPAESGLFWLWLGDQVVQVQSWK